MKSALASVLVASLVACGTAPEAGSPQPQPSSTNQATGSVTGDVNGTIIGALVTARWETPGLTHYPPFVLTVMADTADGTFSLQSPAGATGTIQYVVYLADVPTPGVYADTDLSSCAVLTTSTSETPYPFATTGPVAGCEATTQDGSEVTGSWALTLTAIVPEATGSNLYLVHGSIDATSVGDQYGELNGQRITARLVF